MKKHHLLIGILSIAMTTSCKKEFNSGQGIPGDLTIAQAPANPGLQIAEDNIVPNELLIKFKRGTSDDAKANILARIGGNVSEKVLTKAMQRFGDEDGFLVVRASIHAL